MLAKAKDVTMKHGCLIVNLGSPQTPTEKGIRTFLSAMLSDPHIVSLPAWIWKPVLHGIILRVRPKKLVDKYASIWTPEGSPIITITRTQAEMLSTALPEAEVRYAFSYSSPTIDEVLDGWDVDDLTIIPLYPHDTYSTVHSVRKAVLDYYSAHPEHHPHLLFAPSYATEPHMIGWYHQRIQCALAEGPVDEILLSFHGVPAQRQHLAEHYRAQCHATAAAIAAAFPDIPVQVSFQSKFGPAEWLTPATADVVVNMPRRGVKNLVVATPAFVADCLETLEEVGVDYRQRFTEAGGETYRVIPPINTDHAFVDTLVAIFRSMASLNPR